MLSREILEELKGIQTPFYLYDMGLLRRTLDVVKANADKYGKTQYNSSAEYTCSQV